MATIFRRTYSIPLPADAVCVDVKGVASARFRRNGKTITAPLTKAVNRARVRSPFYYGTVDKKTVRLFRDAVASQQRLAELIKKSERKESGVADPFEVHRKRPLSEHLADYRRFLDAKGNGEEHVNKTTARITAIIESCRFGKIGDPASEKVAAFLHGLRRDPPRPVLPVGKASFTSAELTEALGGSRPVKLARVIARECLDPGTGNGPKRTYPRATVESLQEIYCRGISIATSNGYLNAIKGFSRWLLESERTDRDRLVSLTRLNMDVDKRHERRPLDEIELNHVLESAWSSPSMFEGLTGRDRAMVYLLAMSTRLRASEFASVSPSSFDLGQRPIVTVRAALHEEPARRRAASTGRRCRRLPRLSSKSRRAIISLAWKMVQRGSGDAPW